MALFVFAGVVPAAVQHAAAQDRGKTEAAITISRVDGLCAYEIAGQENQDLLVVKPNAKITFAADGTGARIFIGAQPVDQTHPGAKGVRAGQSSAFTIDAGSTAERNARGSFSGPPNERHNTRHKISVFCLNEDGSESSATDRPSLLSHRDVDTGYDQLQGADLRGPNAEAAVRMAGGEVSEGAGPGGPEMEVEDP